MTNSSRRQNVLSYGDDLPPAVLPWLSAMEDTRLRTWEALEGLPADALDWWDEEGASIGSLLYHIAAVELDWLFVEILEQPFTPELEQLFPYDMRDEHGKLSAVHGETLEQQWQRLEQVRSYLMTALQGMAPEEFVRVRSFPHYDVSHLCAVSCLSGSLCQDVCFLLRDSSCR